MKFTGPKSWFHQKRFGMFVHMGIYSVGGIHEQELWRLNRIPPAQRMNDPAQFFDHKRWVEPQKKYEEYTKIYNPAAFDPAQWLDMAQENGLEYITFTTKHHDGFCMWDTRETDFNIMNTPYGKDLFGMLAQECAKRDFPLVVYHSVVDWHQKSYPNQGGDHEIVTDPAYHNMAEYVEFVKRQVRELCTNYGKISGFWWDINSHRWIDHSINDMIRELQPACIINSRGFDPGDYEPMERRFTSSMDPFPGPAEGCDSVGMTSWGYCEEEDYFSIRKLEKQTAFYVARGGNFLLNAGPKPDGTFPERALEILRRTGTWRNLVGDALKAAPRPGIVKLPGVLCTGEGNELNLIFLDPLPGTGVRLEGLSKLPEKAVLLNTGEEVEFTLKPDTYHMHFPPALRLRDLPVDELSSEVMVVRLTFDDLSDTEQKTDGGENTVIL